MAATVENTLYLLQTIEIARNYPHLKVIHDKAMAALEEVVKELEKAAAEPATAPKGKKDG